MLKRLIAGILSSTLIFSIFSSVAVAETIELSQTGNGAESSNEISVNISSDTNVSQSSEANISNNVEQNLDTGNNQVSQNSGDATVKTGDINASAQVDNENINKNTTVSSDCNSNCPSSSINIEASGNGANSNNNVNLNTNNSTNTNQTNVANISNNVTTNANTGNNEANYNNGDVKIVTGNIKSETEIKNSHINRSFNSVSEQNDGTYIKLSKNGANSNNNVNVSKNNSVNNFSYNFIDIFNESIENLNTGGNSANWNNGTVFLKTGDILNRVKIKNAFINYNFFKKVCEICVTPPEEKKPSVEEIIPPKVIEKVTEKVTEVIKEVIKVEETAAQEIEEVGEVLGISGEILPVTGNISTILIMLFGTIMFFSGLYLRIHFNPKE